MRSFKARYEANGAICSKDLLAISKFKGLINQMLHAKSMAQLKSVSDVFRFEYPAMSKWLTSYTTGTRNWQFMLTGCHIDKKNRDLFDTLPNTSNASSLLTVSFIAAGKKTVLSSNASSISSSS